MERLMEILRSGNHSLVVAGSEIRTFDGRGIADLYRLSTLEELESTGYWDAIEDPNALVLIEWLEQVDRAQPIEFVTIDMNFADDSDLSTSARTFALLGHGELYERLAPLFA